MSRAEGSNYVSYEDLENVTGFSDFPMDLNSSERGSERLLNFFEIVGTAGVVVSVAGIVGGVVTHTPELIGGSVLALLGSVAIRLSGRT